MTISTAGVAPHRTIATGTHCSRHRSRGFTLLEVLLALGLLAMLMLSITQLMSQGAEIWNSSDRNIRAVENDKIALDFIRKMLDQSKPVNWKEPNAEGQISKAFVGKPNELYFVAPLPVVSAEKLGLYLFKIAAGKTDEYVNKALIVSYWPLNEESLEKTLENDASAEVIMTDVDSVSFAYFGDSNYSDGLKDPDWQGNWEDMRDFPLAVRLSLKRSRFDPQDPDSVARMAWENMTFGILQRSLR